MKIIFVLTILALITLTTAYRKSIPNLKKQSILDDLSIDKEIDPEKLDKPNNDDKYKYTMNLINETITKDPLFKNHAYESTAYLVDTFGPRVMGSKSLEEALKHLEKLLKKEGFENVKLEEVNFNQKWIRGEEHLILMEPRPLPVKIPMLGLGMSHGGNVTAELVMASDWEELKKLGEAGKIEGKIVFLNPIWKNYDETVKYRKRGATESAKHGAIGCIIRSITPKSTMENPHTGSTYYDAEYKKIPVAAISLQSADMLARMITRGQKVVVNLFMEAHFEKGNFVSHNLIGELTGSKYKEEIIVLGGHVDSWDGGPQTGAEDDAAGLMVCLESLRLLIKKGLRPLRTIRFIAWTGEEFGSGPSKGAEAYAIAHEAEMKNHVLAFESDMGVTDLIGFGFTGGAKSYNLVKGISNLFFKDMKAGILNKNDGYSSDINVLYNKHKIPIMRNLIKDTADMEFYFTYYHSSADNMSILHPDEMDRNVSGISTLLYIIADVPWRLPRD